KVWNLESGAVERTLTGHSRSVTAVAISADGQRGVSGSHDKTLKVWNLESGAVERTLTGHSDWVWAVAISADGQRGVSGSHDNTLKVWNLATGEIIASFTAEAPLYCCAIAPDGVTVVAGDTLGRVHFLRLEGGFFSDQSSVISHQFWGE
ncbi:MAG: WD40 repeat domain-containing protein, partial [Spirulinaceae cyanobacterium]